MKMHTHLTDDELVLHYYGEMSGAEDARAVAQISGCPDCHASYRRLQRVLAVVDEHATSGVELPEHFERTVWARLEPNLSPARPGWLSWFVLSPARLAWVVGIILLTVGAYIAGRLTTPSPSSDTVMNAEQIREGILLIDLGDHLDRSQMVLVELVSSGDEEPVDISGERDRAEQLVAQNRLYRQTARATGDTGIANLLDELERVLVDVAASSGRMSADELNDVRRRIEARELIFKVRVISSQVRDRQRPTSPAAAGQRSSL
jgi:hypothetical protein